MRQQRIRVRSLVGRARRRVVESAKRVAGSGSGPLVSVVVAVHGRAAHLDECVASVLGSGHQAVELLLAPLDPVAEKVVTRFAGPSDRRVQALPLSDGGLDRGVRQARGSYLAFVDGDDALPPDALARLVEALEESGSDLALGPVSNARGDASLAPPWAEAVFARARSRERVETCPDALIGAVLTGTLHRLDWWHSAHLEVGDWAAREVSGARALLASGSFDLLTGTTYVRHARDTSLPVDQQARFRPTKVAAHGTALRTVAGLVRDTDPGMYRRWLVLTLSHVLPPLLVDVVGGGPRALEVLAPLVRDLVADTGPGALAEVPVAARMLARASQGSLHDLALMQDLLADNPHGLPTERSAEGAQVVCLPRGLAVPVPDAVRRIEQVDRVLRTVVGPLRRDESGYLAVQGAAFVEYGERAALPSVTLAGQDGRAVPMAVSPRQDPEINLWARRSWEDRAGAGFTARLEPGAEPPSPDGRMRVDVHLGRRAGSHAVAVGAPQTSGEVLLTGAVLDGRDLLLSGAGAQPTSLRLVGGKGGSPAALPERAGRSWTVRVPLETDLFADRVLLPAGRYDIEALDGSGGPLTATWGREATHGDLVADRLRVVPGPASGRAFVSVAAPLTHLERSAFDQQRMRTQVYAAPSSASYASTVVLETFRGRGVGDSPGAIGREISRRGLDLDLAWVVDDPSVRVPDGTRALARRSERWYDALAGARAYVSNAGAPYWFEKKRGQIHLQTWHGTPLKRIGEDRGPGDFSTWRHRRRIALQAAGWDAMISPSPFCSQVFASAFGYRGRFLEVGYPRNDILLGGPRADRVRGRVRAALGLTDADRAVLYAPTWREYVGVRDSKPLYLDAERLTRADPTVVALVRGHYNSTHQPDVFTDRPRIHDVTRYPDIADLYLAADALVTDYSSVMFDFALTDKPQVLLVPDLDQYRDIERGFYFDLEDCAPGPMVTSTDEVASALAADDAHAEARAALRERFCPWDDGNASTRTVDWLLSQI